MYNNAINVRMDEEPELKPDYRNQNEINLNSESSVGIKSKLFVPK